MIQKKVWVTGNLGFVGSHLAEHLRQKGYSVNEYADVDEVYHLGAHVGSSMYADKSILYDNIALTTEVLAKHPNARILFTSSNEVNYLTSPSQTYAYSKQVCEELIKLQSENYVTVRLGNTYGPRMRKQYVLYQVMHDLKSGISPTWVRNPYDIRTFCYVRDTVEGLVALMESPKTNKKTLNLGSTEPTTILDLYRITAQIMGVQNPTLLKDFPNEAVTVRTVDVIQTEQLTEWQPKVTLSEGIARTVEWFNQL